jgi:hypothetical protein
VSCLAGVEIPDFRFHLEQEWFTIRGGSTQGINGILFRPVVGNNQNRAVGQQFVRDPLDEVICGLVALAKKDLQMWIHLLVFETCLGTHAVKKDGDRDVYRILIACQQANQPIAGHCRMGCHLWDALAAGMQQAVAIHQYAHIIHCVDFACRGTLGKFKTFVCPLKEIHVPILSS